MIILGIDPALTITGYGVIQAKGSQITLCEAGIIRTTAKETTPKRLDKIYRGIIKLIEDTKPDCLVVEKIYSHSQHPATAYILGQARGVICLAAATKNIPFFEYAATRIKKAIVGKGLASKAQVQRMVASSLSLKDLPKYLDVTDALALAIAHSYIGRVKI
ncbi:MAG: crossover junction endodeoxyribonuclease RuvC [Candidatus Omnitrophica bacterium]|jgi:crossover junction endodeoxyribonuclease RuvC|nr:crossover junction endodeoxyribonuclease RuvC [Candidatus Omnitrophota bacterium]